VEEQGGFILKSPDKEDYEFIPVTSDMHSNPGAVGLYVANTEEFGNKILAKTIDGFKIHASFHTHPVGMRALPSSTDLSELFTSFPINYIYAPFRELNRFTYNDGEWEMHNVLVFDGFDPYKHSRKPKVKIDALDSWIESENL